MLLIFLASLVLITFGCAAFQYIIRSNMLGAASVSRIPDPVSRSYKPMIRLLSAEDFDLASASPQLRRELRKRRRRIFRAYLRCLAKDYARLIGGVQWIMVNSTVDRPDLAAQISRQRRQFAIAYCRVEWLLALHTLGFENVKIDVSGLVSAVDNLTGIVNVFGAVRA